MDSKDLPLQVGVKVLLKNDEGKFLLLRRNPKTYPEVGPKWDIPGGRIHLQVPLLENLRRELKEETGLDLEGEPFLVSAQDILRPEKHVVRLTYVGLASGVLNLDEDHNEAKWFTSEEIKSMSGEVLDLFFKELVDRGVVLG